MCGLPRDYLRIYSKLPSLENPLHADASHEIDFNRARSLATPRSLVGRFPLPLVDPVSLYLFCPVEFESFRLPIGDIHPG